MGTDLFAGFGLDANSNEARDARHALDVYESTIQALVACRMANGLKQKQVAARMETQQSAISDLENLAGDARFSTVIRYAQAIGVNLKIDLVRPHSKLNWTRGEAGGTVVSSQTTKSRLTKNWIELVADGEPEMADVAAVSAAPSYEAA
ncbi:helix-turn-helix transcriptional regulator [Clavibacter michiganensis subsp. michiganensis]|uniref:helix-turn-helix domain-containing protein n=1 Tax=Clavibacter michiganensis TaxID=28447 RepID=UPI00345C5068